MQQAEKRTLKKWFPKNEINGILLLEKLIRPGSFLENSLLLLQSRYESLLEDDRKGIVHRQEYNVEKQQVIEGFLSIIDQLVEEELVQDFEQILAVHEEQVGNKQSDVVSSVPPAILFIDDDQGFLTKMEIAFKSDFEVFVESGLFRAIKTFEKNKGKIKLVLLDLVLDGHQANFNNVKRIKEYAPQVPIIVISANSITDRIYEIESHIVDHCGADDFLYKSKYEKEKWLKIFNQVIGNDTPPI